MTASVSCPEPSPDRRARRADAMIAAAKTLFLERGYDAVSLTEIVQVSGGSLATLYALFGSKLGLLAAVVDTERHDGIRRLRAILERDAAPAEILIQAAGHLLDLIADPQFLGLIRLVMSQVLTSPEFAQRIYSGCHEPLIGDFAILFAQWNRQGRATMPDPEMSAHMFASLFFHAPQLRAMFRDPRAPELCDRPAMLARAVDMFMAAASIGREP